VARAVAGAARAARAVVAAMAGKAGRGAAAAHGEGLPASPDGCPRQSLRGASA